MGEFKRIFRKVGGTEILKQYKIAGVLGFALIEILILGFSRKSLEILRLSVQFKIQKKLKKKYNYVLKSFKQKYMDILPHMNSNRVWICWLQGIDNAPLLVQRCYESIQKNLQEKDIIVITADNFSKYVSFPDYIIEKWNKGIITNTHFSDLLRLELLIRYGGIWLDATVLCTSGDVPHSMFHSHLFLYQTLKPGSNGHCVTISSWLIYARSNNKLLLATRKLLYEYWIKNNAMVDYYLFHIFFSIVCEEFPEDWDKVPKFCNTIPHILLLEMFEKFNDERFNNIKRMSCFHKLSYKREKELLDKKGTFYDVIINEGLF
jgi:hypothetical protein